MRIPRNEAWKKHRQRKKSSPFAAIIWRITNALAPWSSLNYQKTSTGKIQKFKLRDLARGNVKLKSPRKTKRPSFAGAALFVNTMSQAISCKIHTLQFVL